MSLMNDALRKKNRGATEIPAATGFPDASQRRRATRKWLVVLVAVLLFSMASLAGLHLMQSASGKSLLAKGPQPKHVQPFEDHTTETTAATEGGQDSVTPIQASGSDTSEIKKLENPPKENRFAAASESTSTPSTPGSNASDTRLTEDAPSMKTVAEKPLSTTAAKASTPMQASVEPLSVNKNTVARNFEPGPEKTVQRGQTAAAAPRHVNPSPSSPAPPAPAKTSNVHNSGTAGRKTDRLDQQGDLFYRKALAYHRNGRLAEAIRLYQRVLKSNPNHPAAMQNLAAAYMQQGNYFDAQPLLKQLEQSIPRPQGVLLNLAIAAIGIGQPEKALDYLDRAIAASDASPWEIRFNRAVALARMNRLPEALALYRLAEGERPNDSRLQFNMAVTCDAMGLYPQALAHYETALQVLPDTSETDAETIIQRIRTIRRYLGTIQSPLKG